ncbi:MAG: hypothetical protein ACJ8F3_05425 [Xanthobacteraceae bacterium]
MMYAQSPSSRPLAVPGIGFPQNISTGRNVFGRLACSELAQDRGNPGQRRVRLIDRISWLPRAKARSSLASW